MPSKHLYRNTPKVPTNYSLHSSKPTRSCSRRCNQPDNHIGTQHMSRGGNYMSNTTLAYLARTASLETRRNHIVKQHKILGEKSDDWRRSCVKVANLSDSVIFKLFQILQRNRRNLYKNPFISAEPVILWQNSGPTALQSQQWWFTLTGLLTPQETEMSPFPLIMQRSKQTAILTLTIRTLCVDFIFGSDTDDDYDSNDDLIVCRHPLRDILLYICALHI